MKKTWLKAIKVSFFIVWPGLAYHLVSKTLQDDTEQTAAGHLHQQRQGIHSMKVPEDDFEPELKGQATINIDRIQRVGIHLISFEELNGMIETDQNGRFSITSQRRMKCIMCLYNYNAN